jgi:ribose 5-phosphate isomerase A
LSTADHHTVGIHPRVNIGSARWVKFRSARTAQRFICIADAPKRVDVLGRFPLPVEVIAMAAAQVARRFEAIGGRAVLRDGVLTDNGHPLLDVHGLTIADPLALEAEIN